MVSTNHPYDRYRPRLAALSNDDLIGRHLKDFALRNDWSENHPWARIYGRFTPPEMMGGKAAEQPIITLLYEQFRDAQHLCAVEFFDEPPPAMGYDIMQVHLPEIGWMRITAFPNDANLPALKSAMATMQDPVVMRYRPGKRCTLRVGRSASTGSRYAKVFADQRGAEIHQESLSLWQEYQEGNLDFAVAEPLGWDEALQTLWQAPVAGQPLVERLCSSEGPHLAQRMGRAAASISQSSLQPQAKTGSKKQLKRTAKCMQRLCRLFPQLKETNDAIMEQLLSAHVEIEDSPLHPIHGAPHAKQWLDDGTQLALVDFDGLALGPPELDAATFMTEMDFEKRDRVPVDAINHHFISAYEAVAGPLDHRLLRLYRVHKRLSKALRNAYAIRPDGAERVEAVLNEALILLYRLA